MLRCEEPLNHVCNPDPVFEFQVLEDGFGELALDCFVSFGGDIKSMSFFHDFSFGY